MWRNFIFLIPLIAFVPAADAKVWTVDGEPINLVELIDKAESRGNITRVQANQLKANEASIYAEEATLKRKHKDVITFREQSALNEKVIQLRQTLKRISCTRADNTASNFGDGRAESPTAQVQSSKKGDIAIVTSIRKALIKENTLSSNAKNAKVVVINGKVTLRGPVNSSAEKSKIFAIAEDCVGQKNILNELQVLTR